MKNEKISSFKNKKRKFALLLFIIIFFVGNIGFYIKERAKWIYEGQPYPQAKEWLIPANMMLVYGTILTKLPFIDERSFIMKPIIGLQDYFVKKWQENLPDDDAEKYLGWYIFRLRTYIEPNGGGIILYGSKQYTFSEVRKFNEQSWQTIEAMVKYETKDKEFNEIRLAAFNNLTALFVSNFTAYWVENPDGIGSVLSSESKLNIYKMYQDVRQHERLFKIYKWIKQMDKTYKNKYPKAYANAKNAEASQYWENSRMHELTNAIIEYFITRKKYLKILNFCEVDKNEYLKDYIDSKKWLLKNEDFLKTKNISLKTTISKRKDKQIERMCPNINIKKELSYGNSNN